MRSPQKKTAFASFVALFTSVGTLLCCALPAVLVAIGAGATLAGVITVFPQLTFLSAYKEATFAIAGILLFGAWWIYWRNRHAPCPLDPGQAKMCKVLKSISKWVLLSAVLIYMTGFFFAFVAVHVFYD